MYVYPPVFPPDADDNAGQVSYLPNRPYHLRDISPKTSSNLVDSISYSINLLEDEGFFPFLYFFEMLMPF